MAGISFDFGNIIGSKKCAVSSSRIGNLEIGAESPDARESVFQGSFFNDQVSDNDGGNNSNLIFGCNKPSDKNFLIISQSSLSTSICDDRRPDKIKSVNDNDIDIGLLDLLNSAKLEKSVKSDAENFTIKDSKSVNKMKIIPNGEVSDGLSDLLSSVVHESVPKDEVDTAFKYCQRKNTPECGIDLLDFEFVKNEHADCVSSSNSSLKVEGNLSDLLSSIIIDDVAKPGSFNSSSVCALKSANKCESEADFSDLLSSIELGDSNNSKSSVCDRDKNCHPKDAKTKNESCLSDLLSSIDKSTKQETSVTNLSDLLSSIDLGVSNGINCNGGNGNALNTKSESCLSDLLSSIDIEESNKPVFGDLNSKPLTYGSSNVCLDDNNGTSDLLSDFTFDTVSCSSTSNSCASSYSDTENNSPKDSVTKNLPDKVFESDSGYSSFESERKEFSFFDYSSDNKFSFNTMLTNKSDAVVPIKHHGLEDTRNTNEEMSMSDLMTIVSPEFRNPVLATLGMAKNSNGHLKTGNSNMLDLVESLSVKSNNCDSDVLRNNAVKCDENLMNSDCVDGRISKNGMCLEKVSNDRSDLINGDDNVASDDEQTTFIDLRECIKSADHQFIPTSPIKQFKSTENKNLECFSPNKTLFCSEGKSDSPHNRSNLFEFNDTVPRKKSKANTKQSIFSKALACKPKRDIYLIQKVTNIKNELLNNIIHRPVFIDCDVPQPKLESVIQADKCIFTNAGRRYFGLDPPCES